MEESRQSHLSKTPLLLAGIFLAALAVRFLPVGQVISGDGVYFYDGDCYVHIRKILLHIRNFPAFVTFDPYEGYPGGTGAVWPPLLDYLLSLLSLAMGLGEPSRRLVEITAAMVPPFLGVLSVLALYRFVRPLFGDAAALFSALILAFMPAHMAATVVGRPDNEMTEPLMTTILFMSFLPVMEGEGRSFRRLIPALAAAFVTLLLWRGATLWIALLALYSFIDLTVEEAESPAERGGRLASFFALLSLLLAIFCLLNPFGNQDRISFNILSWFHVILFAAAAFFLSLYGTLLGIARQKGFGRFHFVAALLAVLLAVTAAIYVSSPSMAGNLLAGMGILGIGRTDPWIDSIAQYGALFDGGPAGVRQLLTDFGGFILLLPAAFFLLLGKGRRARDILYFCFLAISVLILALLRRRFEHILALFAAAAGGYLIAAVYAAMRGKGLGRVGAAAAATGLFCILGAPFGIHAVRAATTHPGFPIGGAIADAVAWMRENTPSPGDPYDNRLVPSYAVMARWDYAGWIEYPGERPVVATLYGFETSGLKESAAFFLSRDEAEATEILDRTGVRYVMIAKTVGALQTFAAILGKDGAAYARVVEARDGGKVYQPGPAYYDLVATRLLMADGREMQVGPVRFEPLDHFRLIYESAEPMNLVGFPEEVKQIKIFEYVRGARLTVKASPGEKVTLSKRVVSNRGRSFTYTKSALADGEGRAAFILPYESDGDSLPYVVEAGGRSQTLFVSRQGILAGAQKETSF